MSDALLDPAAALTSLVAVADQAKAYARQSKAANTWRAYAADWRDFEEWCAEHGQVALPAAAETVALYLVALAEHRKVSTLQRHISAISQAHQAVQLESPTQTSIVRTVMAGIRRSKGTAQIGKAPAVTATIRRMLNTLPDSLLGTRDRALLLLGFASALRRSELVGLDLGDLAFTDGGIVVTLRHSKTDQERAGRKLGIPYDSTPTTCPVRMVKAWLAASGITGGPIFRPINRHGQLQPQRLSDKAVALIVKHMAKAAGLDPSIFAGHSLRSGLATAAAEAGASERAIMN
jgi:site-specific recombinase XerD